MSISSELFCFSVTSWMSWQLYRSAHISSGTITIYCLFLMTLACLSLSEYMWFSTMPRRLFTAFRLPPFFRAGSMNRFILNFRISACDAFWWTESSAISMLSAVVEIDLLCRFLIKSFVSFECLPVSCPAIMPPTFTAHYVIMRVKFPLASCVFNTASSSRFCSAILNYSTFTLTLSSLIYFFRTSLLRF